MATKIYLVSQDQLTAKDTELKGLLTAEAQLRANEDTNLKNRIDSLEVASGKVPEDLMEKLAALDQVENGAQVNKIEKIKVGDAEVEGTEKVADITAALKSVIATETADLALKIVAVDTVEELPATGASQTVYLVKNSGTGTNAHDEYIWTGTAYEMFGTTEIDLSDYVTTGKLTEALAPYAKTADVTTAVGAVSDEVTTLKADAVHKDTGVSNVKIGKDATGLYIVYDEAATE